MAADGSGRLAGRQNHSQIRDIFRNGVSYPFGPYQIVTYVGDAYNDTFSSVWPG